MTGADVVLLLPLALPAAAGIAVMLAGALGGRGPVLHALALSGPGAGIVAVLTLRPRLPGDVTALLRMDGYAALYLVLLYAAVGAVITLARPYLASRRLEADVFYTLVLFAAAGMGVLAAAIHLASFFLGLEILTLSLYGLIGYLARQRRSLEAAFKYLLLAAVASVLLLLGVALLYAATGSMRLSRVAARLAELAPAVGVEAEAAWAVAGALLLMVGFGFKLALVPFHMWSPDVYEGAPAPVTTLIATGSKGAVLAAMLRILAPLDLAGIGLEPVIAGLAALTMVGGTLLALLQEDLKRLLAYSSVAHLGYVMVAVAAGGLVGSEAVTLYVVVYVLTTLGAFGVVVALSSGGAEASGEGAYRGLARRRPGLAAALTVMLLSLAGIPPTAGFLGKFAVLGAAVAAGASGLAVLLALASGVGVYYYLRVIVAMYMREPTEEPTTSPATAPGVSTGLAVLTALVLAIGVFPGPWLDAVARAVAALY